MEKKRILIMIIFSPLILLGQALEVFCALWNYAVTGKWETLDMWKIKWK